MYIYTCKYIYYIYEYIYIYVYIYIYIYIYTEVLKMGWAMESWAASCNSNRKSNPQVVKPFSPAA